MAEEEAMEKLKQKRSVAQTAFTKRANHLASRVNSLDESELKREEEELQRRAYQSHGCRI